ncbi:MAG TPA: BatD family protein [Haliangium sp.]|nr:BatD family protein [Haliangium sp.]
MSKRVVGVVVAAVALAGLAATAHAQQVTLHVQGQGRDLYAGLPFVLAVSAEGFEPEPQPEVAPFEIPGCKVTFMGVAPNVATSLTIINGMRRQERRVEFVYRYRVEAPRAEEYSVPAITVTQGTTKVSTRPATLRAIAVPSSDDMRIQLGLPQRALWVGETFDLYIDWLLRRDPGEPSFSIPLLDDPSWIDVHTPSLPDQQRQRQTLTLTVGDREIEVPYVQENVTTAGSTYTRVRMTLPVTPVQAGRLEIAPAQVVAGLQVGNRRDIFGFSARTELFKAEDVPRVLEIRPLPLADRPPSFAGAVGTAFSIKVQASRTVVRVGEPIELEILIRGDGRMEGLSLPPLVNAQGLSEELFAVVDSAATGEMVDGDQGKGKRFRVSVRLQSAEAREIPRIGFSYFDPARGQYHTVYSEPIALQVAGSSVVGAADVVSAVKRQAGASNGASGGTAGAAGGDGAGAAVGSFVGADFALSNAGDTLAAAWTARELWPALAAIYAAALLLLGVRVWHVRTRERRGQSSEVKQALRVFREALARAGSAPAREAAPELLSALRGLARVTGQRAAGDVIARIETESYSPAAAREPIAASVRADAEALADAWVRARRKALAGAAGGASSGASSGASAVALLLLPGVFAGVVTGAGEAAAQTAQAPAAQAPAVPSADAAARIEEARAAYSEALAQTDRDARTRAFARAEGLFRAVADTCPDCPALLTDWGNAALGAQDLGRATLAYRRALALDPGHDRAERNLAWVRERAPAWLPRPGGESAADSLFFWHYTLSLPARHVIAAVAFAAAVLLLAPWAWRPRLRRSLAAVPAVIWLAMVLSILYAPDPGADAVVLVDATALRTADSAGAPPALPNPLPAGAEVVIRESRGSWTGVALANGTTGWLPSSAIERVQPLP